MSSIIEGYNYDIFISYRQKDNKGDRWVSEFVEALKTELESTFKEEINVYFDINPHDGLLETHDVDASLKDKLKCLVFIPIISRTYCDPKSFAWEHEFKAFIEEASKDQFGLKIKLPNGNVASRVLPVRIHDLDNNDTKLCESVLGGVLRGIEFIYKEPGVDKPLAPADNEKKNINNTQYRIQIIKVALAIKEIILGLKTSPILEVKEKSQHKEPLEEQKKEESTGKKKVPIEPNKLKWLLGVPILTILIITAIFAYPRIFHSDKSKTGIGQNGKMSIVVNRFDNNTGNAKMDSWRDIIPDLLRGYLATSKELSVQNSQTMFEVYESMKQTKNASFESSQSNEAAKRLNADSYITGSFQSIKNKTLIVVNLINTKSSEVLMTRTVEGNLDTDYKNMTDSLSRQMKNFLEIKALEKNVNPEYEVSFTNSVEAYRKYIEGMKSYNRGDYMRAFKALSDAYQIDSTFTLAAFFCANAIGWFDERYSVMWERRAYTGKERLPVDYQIWLEMWHAYFANKNPDSVLVYANSIEKSEIKSRYILFDVGLAFWGHEKFTKAVNMFKKVEKINLDRGEDWKFRDYYIYFASACHRTDNLDKEANVIETGLKLFPDDIELNWMQAKLAVSKGNAKKATGLIKKCEYLCKQTGLTESQIQANIGNLYEEVDSLDKAEKYYRQALSLQPDDPQILNDLAWLLINYNRNTNEGLQLINKALALGSDNSNSLFLKTKGWGLYKQGKYDEALEFLNKSISSNIGDSYDIKLLLKEVEKAIANQKKNK